MGAGTLVVGTITRDFVESPGVSVVGALGGSATYFALATRFFGPVQVVGRAAREDERDVRRLLPFADLSAVTFDDAPTATWRARRETPGADAVTLERFVSAAQGYEPRLDALSHWPGTVFLGSIEPQVQLAVEAAAPAGALVGGDTMDVFIDEQRHEVERMLRGCAIAFLTVAEVEALTRTRGVAAGAAELTDAFGLEAIVVKRGPRGALLWTRDAAARMPPVPAVVVDPTGAGDALAGAFLGHLAQAGGLDGESLRESLRLAMVVAAFAIEGAGTERLAALSEAELWERARSYRAGD